MQHKDPDLRRRIRGDAGRSYELAAVLVCPVPTRSPPACSHGIVSLKACSPLPNGVPPLRSSPDPSAGPESLVCCSSKIVHRTAMTLGTPNSHDPILADGQSRLFVHRGTG